MKLKCFIEKKLDKSIEKKCVRYESYKLGCMREKGFTIKEKLKRKNLKRC